MSLAVQADGYNPLRWDCANGCYNQKHRPKIEVFAECFGGKINFGDVDAGIVEHNSRALYLEWKRAPVAMPKGQDIMYRNLSATGFMVVLTVAGDAELMSVSHVGWYVAGEYSGWAEGDLDKAKEVCRRWYKRAHALGPVKMRRALPAQKLLKPEHAEWVADYEAHERDFDKFY